MVWGYRGDAARAEARGLNGDAVRRLCEGDILSELDVLRSMHSHIPADHVHHRWGVTYGEVLAVEEAAFFKAANTCWR